MKNHKMNDIIGRPILWSCLGLVLAAVSGIKARAATIDVVLQPANQVFEVGDAVDVNVLATTDDLLIGYGFDLGVDDDSLLLYDGFDTDSGFTAVPAPDGDGLAGLSFGGGVAGAGVLLGVAHYTALAPGQVLLDLSTTDGDLTEGFARFGEGFFELVSDPVEISIVGNLDAAPIGGGGGGSGPGSQIPEPATVVLLATGMIALVRTRANPRQFMGYA